MLEFELVSKVGATSCTSRADEKNVGDPGFEGQ
jgi:hypothetical protein